MMTTAHENKKWHVAYTFPNFERKAYNSLLQKSVDAFLPLHKVIRQWSDRKKRVEVPMFPSYIFVNTSSRERFNILNTTGIVRFVSFEGTPAEVSAEEIASIKRIATAGVEVFTDQVFEEGNHVRVVRGAFAGLEGLLFEKKGNSRFGVRIKALEQILSIDICVSCLEKINKLSTCNQYSLAKI